MPRVTKRKVKRKRPSSNHTFQKKMLAALSRIERSLSSIQTNQNRHHRHPGR